MQIKYDVVGWYIKRFIIPKSQTISDPGIISFNMSGKTPVYIRQVLIPEKLFVNLENKVIEEYGNKAKQELYSLGKRFGYRFALAGNFLTKKDNLSEKKFKNYIGQVIKFIEGTYASYISFQIDVKKPSVVYSIYDFVVSSAGAKGYFMPLGATAGMNSRLFADNSIEAAFYDKQEEPLKIISEKPGFLKKRKEISEFFEENSLNNLFISNHYFNLNKSFKSRYSRTSLKELLDSKIFAYVKGRLSYNNLRYFIYEVSGLQLIEEYFSSNKKKKELLFNISFDLGKQLFNSIKKINMISNFFGAFGWGDVLITKKENKINVIIYHYPFTKFCEKGNFIIIRGLLSGILSKYFNKEIKLTKALSRTSFNSFDVILKED